MFGFMLFSFFASALLFAVVWLRWSRARPALVIAGGAAVVAIISAAVNENSRLNAERLERYYAQLREQYPLQSVAGRLNYEGPQAVAEPATLSSVVEQNLQAAEDRGRPDRRAEAFEHLHGDKAFAARWRYEIMNVVSLPTPRAIPMTELPPRRGCEPAPTPEYVPSSPEPADSATPFAAIRRLHDNGAADFLDPERFGYVKDREHVAGFEPHAFASMPAMGSHRTSNGEWKLEHLDLVSLRKSQGPYVYVSENLPKLDDLRTADTRLLDDFETRALSQLRTEEDVVVEETGDTVRMLGALRAGNHCLRCHSAQRGELIGAFTYELLKKEPPAESKTEQPPQT